MKRRIISILVVVLFVSMTVMPPCGYAQVLPENGNIVFGNGTITVNGQDMAVDLTTPQAIIEWLSFCIAQGYTVNFNMPGADSVVLNRVMGADPSVIMGNLLSNGQIFLVNPNGILFGASAYVNAPGVVAATLNISDDDFKNGNYVFDGVGGSVINNGSIFAPGGYVALLGSSIENAGMLVSVLGTVALAVGEKITMSLDPLGLINVVVDEAMTTNVDGASDAIKNTGTISANGGTVLLKTNSLNGIFDNAINNEGIIEAKSLAANDGHIILEAEGTNQSVVSSGTIEGTDVDISADGSLLVQNVIGDTVDLEADTIDAYSSTPNVANITANSLNLSARHGIGQNAASGITTHINDLYAYNNGTGGIRITDLFGDLNVVDALASGSGGDVEITSNGDMTIGKILAFNHRATLTSENGAIADGNGSMWNIYADSALLSSKKGIGVADAIETHINDLYAYNNGTGGIRITDLSGDLNVVDALASGSGGDVEITSQGDMTIGKILAFNHRATLTSENGAIADGNGSMWNIYADSALLSAKKGIGVADAIETYIDDLYAYNNGTGGIRITDIIGNLNVVDALASGSGGDVEITSQGDMTIGKILAFNNSAILTSNNGAILDGNGSLVNLIADTVRLVAKNGIGTDLDSLEIRPFASNGILNLIASNWNDGGIHLSQTAGDLNVMIANANLGDIILDAYGDILLGKDTNPAVSGLTAHNGLVSLISNNGEIVDFNGDNWNIDADSIFLSAINGIGSSDTIEVHTHNLSAYNSNSGDIRVRDINGDLYVDSVINDASNGSVYLTASGENNPNPGWDNKEIYLGTVKSKNGVYLEATNGAIVDNNGSALNIDSLYTSLLAYRGIGTALDAIETKVDAIDFANVALGDVNIENSVNTASALILGNANAWNTGTGNISVRELVGDMIAGGNGTGVIAAGGEVDLYSQGNMFLNYVKADGTIDIEAQTGDLIFGTPGISNAIVESYNGGVNLLADNGSVLVNSIQTTPHIIANGDSSILTPHGKITPTGTPLDVDIDGTLSVDLTNYQISNIVNAPVPPPMDVFGNMTGTITGGIMIPILTGTMNPSPLNPPGYVYYNGIQIWPPKMVAPSIGGSEEILASIEKVDKAYWEILDPYRYASFSQDTPVFYLYHPLEEVDEGAFDDINLDTDAYEFIEENINLKKELNPYFGWLDDQEISENTI